LYARYVRFIDPSSFTVNESIFVLAIVIVGGAGNLWGSLAGTALLIVVPEMLRFVGLPSPVAANLRAILYGTILVLLMAFRPQGAFGEYDFRRVGPEDVRT